MAGTRKGIQPNTNLASSTLSCGVIRCCYGHVAILFRTFCVFYWLNILQKMTPKLN